MLTTETDGIKVQSLQLHYSVLSAKVHQHIWVVPCFLPCGLYQAALKASCLK
jgi:hypothetical protein